MIDDILQRLAPSLKRHIGCTIIDINPGPGLWSSKLHDYLRPRSHILVEPGQDLYLPYLKPLLDTPNSRYHLRDWQGSVPWQPDSYVAEGLLPDLKASGTTPSEPAGRNDSLLIVANMSSLAENPKLKPNRSHESHTILANFTKDARNRIGFHFHGPVRLLMWVRELEKQSILPRSVASRRKLAFFLEMTCHVEEIVTGLQWREKTQAREDLLNIESGKQVAERMREQSIQIPLKRQDSVQRKVQDILRGVTKNCGAASGDLAGMVPDTTRDWHKELRRLRADFDSGKLSHIVGYPPDTEYRRKRRNGLQSYTPEWLQLLQMERTFKSQQLRKNELNSLMLEEEKLDYLTIHAYQESLSETERQERLEELDRRTRELKAQLESLSVSRFRQYNFAMDNRRAFAQDPPLLMWDQRTAEPLLSRKNEFYSPKEMCLLDVQPRFPSPYTMTIAQDRYFNVILNTLLRHNSRSLMVLRQLAPGAMEALTPQVPALQDPRKGGRRDLKDLRCRVLTPEMAYGLAMALDKWAFKPILTRQK